jgi:hypothetical protein
MSIFKNPLKSSNYSPTQYYFPYFFNTEEFNRHIKEFGLISEVVFKEKERFPEYLKIKSLTAELIVPFWTRLMIDSNQNIVIWESDNYMLNISIYSPYDLNKCVSALELNINELAIGDHDLPTPCILTNFVTYIRKDNLKYSLDYYERFVLVIISNNRLTLIPLNWFNEKGGDYGYVWPATAQIDLTNNKLKGSGMRMADFEVDLYSPSIHLIS